METLIAFEKPKLLKDKSRLQEIFDLRVLAYEHSHKAAYVNQQVFPKGWKDELDELETTHHWIIEDDNKIIATGRLAILDDLKATGEHTDGFTFPPERPFAYYSRLVIHPDFRGLGLASILDNIRMDFLHQNQAISFAICWATFERKKSLNKLGFKCIGETEYQFGGGSKFINHSFYLYTK